MDTEKIALTTYTIRDHCRSEDDFRSSMQRLREIGYRNVQISGVPLEPARIRSICDEAGMNICATHEPAATIVEHPEAVIETLHVLGCTATAYPCPHVTLDSRKAVLDLARQLDRAGAALKKAGMVLTYHNHAHELVRIDGRCILDMLYDSSDPAHLQGEIDTYWIQRGGADPVAWCRKMKGRLPLLHLKDYEIVNEQRGEYFGAIGDGNLDWPAILTAAMESGCDWFIVEQDGHWLEGDPFLSAKRSFDFLCALTL